MNLQGSWLLHPIQPDQRGTTATTADRAKMVAQSIASFLMTRQGERVMLPDYGLRDFVFSVMDAGFATRLAFDVARVRNYEPLIDKLRVRVGVLLDDVFRPGFFADQQRAAVSVEYTVRGSNTPHNLVYPTWELQNGS